MIVEMRMIQQMYSHTRLNRIKNEVIRNKEKAKPIEDKMGENQTYVVWSCEENGVWKDLRVGVRSFTSRNA